MSQRISTTHSPNLGNETTWLDLREDRTSDLLSHLISDNKALEQLRNALEDDLRSTGAFEQDLERASAAV